MEHAELIPLFDMLSFVDGDPAGGDTARKRMSPISELSASTKIRTRVASSVIIPRAYWAGGGEALRRRLRTISFRSGHNGSL